MMGVARYGTEADSVCIEGDVLLVANAEFEKI